MLIATGQVKLNELINSLLIMAKDKNEIHEYNNLVQGNFTHRDGWGIAYLDDENRWIASRSKKACYKDPIIDEFRDIKTSMAILHARKATGGDVALKNTHPFHFQKNLEDYFFCHNGSIGDTLNYDMNYIPKGQTDSERLFSCIISTIEKGKEIEAIKKQLQSLENFTGANFIMATKNEAFATVKYSKNPEYYRMKLGRNSRLVVVSSEVLPNLSMKWSKLSNGNIIRLEPKSLEYSKYNI